VRSTLSLPLDIQVAAEAGASSAHLRCKEYAATVSLADHASQQTHHAAITMVLSTEDGLPARYHRRHGRRAISGELHSAGDGRRLL